MEQMKAFVAIVAGAVCLVLAFMLFGWWLLVPAGLGIAWELAGRQVAKRPSTRATDPRCVASQLSKPASTVTWQETVEAIERARPGKADQA